MKKTLIFVLAIAACVCLCSCAGGGDTTKDTADNTGSTNAVEVEKYYFEASSVKFSPNDNVADFIENLGAPSEYFESESCAFQGLDKVYTYAGFVIRTYPKDDKDYVLNIELKDDSVATPEGAYIGDTTDAVKQIYGTPDDETPTALIYKKGTTLLYFIYADDTVTAITYTAEV